jgi:hypothetical protein
LSYFGGVFGGVRIDSLIQPREEELPSGKAPGNLFGKPSTTSGLAVWTLVESHGDAWKPGSVTSKLIPRDPIPQFGEETIRKCESLRVRPQFGLSRPGNCPGNFRIKRADVKIHRPQMERVEIDQVIEDCLAGSEAARNELVCRFHRV